MLLSGHKFRKAVNTAKIVSVFSLLNSAVNMTLPAFAAERRAAAPAAALLLPDARRCQSISFASTALSSKPAARR